MIKPSVQELQALGQGYTIVPVYKEILSDVRTPISVLKALKKVKRQKNAHCRLQQVPYSRKQQKH